MITVDGVEMVDVREAARLVGRNPETVRRWIWNGRITAHRDGNRLLLSRAALLAVASAGAQTAEPLDSSLAAWAQRARRSQRGRGRGSAADLVLDDRAKRQSTDGGGRGGR